MSMGMRRVDLATIGRVDAKEPGFVDRVYDRIATEPDGLTRRELWELTPPGRRRGLWQAVALLIERRRVVEVTRAYPPDGPHEDHRRLMSLRGDAIR